MRQRGGERRLSWKTGSLGKEKGENDLRWMEISSMVKEP